MNGKMVYNGPFGQVLATLARWIVTGFVHALADYPEINFLTYKLMKRNRALQEIFCHVHDS